MTIRIIKHEAVPQTGSFEVRFSDGRPMTTYPQTTTFGEMRASEHKRMIGR